MIIGAGHIPFHLHFSRRFGETPAQIRVFLAPFLDRPEPWGCAFLESGNGHWILYGVCFEPEFLVDVGRFFGIASRAYEFQETSLPEVSMRAVKNIDKLSKSYPMNTKLIPVNDTIVGVPIFKGNSDFAKKSAIEEYRRGNPVKARVIAVGPHATKIKPGDTIIFPVAQGTMVETANGLYVQHPENKLMAYEKQI